MMNDVKALCDSPNVPGLINFYGAYHVPDSGQVRLRSLTVGMWASLAQQTGACTPCSC